MRFSRIWRPTARWSWTRRSASAASASSDERAQVDGGLRRSGAVSTEVTVTMPQALVGVGQPLELLGDHLAQDLVDPQRARVGAAPVSATCHWSSGQPPHCPSHVGGRPSGPGDLPLVVGLDDVAVLQVLVVREADTALEPGLHLTGVVLEPAQRGDGALPDDRPRRAGSGPWSHG